MNKPFLTFFVCLSFLLGAWQSAQAQLWPGSGTPEDPYLVSTPQQLHNIALTPRGCFRLTNDIDLTGFLSPDSAGYFGGKGWMPIGYQEAPFYGSLNGAGYKITGLWSNRPDEDFVGLFGYMRKLSNTEGRIDSLGVEIAVGKKIVGKKFVGGLLAFADGGYTIQIKNCYVIGDVEGTKTESVGGLIGRIEGTIQNCFSKGTVKGTEYVGGLIGYLKGTISNSYTFTTVIATRYVVGGFIGSANNSTITNCYAMGTADGNSTVGGFLGSAGYSSHSNLINCYAVVSVSGSDVGSLVGFSSELGGSRVYFDKQVSEKNAVGFLDRFGPNTVALMGKSSVDMKTQSTFEDWDFDSIWAISLDKNQGYPYLRWQTGVDDTVFAESIELSKHSIVLALRQSDTLKATVLPPTTKNSTVRYISADTTIAKINEWGAITPVKKGRTLLYGITLVGAHKDSCLVEVEIPVDSVQLSETTLTLVKGASHLLSATVFPAQADYPSIYWTSEDSTIAKVDSTGLVNTFKKGETHISVTTQDGGYTQSCLVQVVVPLTGIAINLDSLHLYLGENSILTATQVPSDANKCDLPDTNDCYFRWDADDPAIVRVKDDGTLLPTRVGTTWVIVSTQDQKFKDSCYISVTDRLSIDHTASPPASFSVYPNPTKGKISLESSSLPALPIGQWMELFDSRGKRIASYPLSGIQTSVDLSSFPPGIYLIKIKDQEIKVIKQ